MAIAVRHQRPPLAPGTTCPFERRALRLLMVAPIVRRNGSWRFGAARIRDAVIERLAAEGRIDVTADRVTLRQQSGGSSDNPNSD